MLWPTQPRAQLHESVRVFTNRLGVVLHGEPGVGKTQLATDIRESLIGEHPDRHVWFTVTGSHLESALPFSAIEALLPGLEVSDTRSPARIARLLQTHLIGQANGKLVAIVIDDAHLLDAASAEVLAHVCRLETFLLLGTVRSGQTATNQLVRMWCEDPLRRVDVPPFTPDEVGEVVGAALGGPVDSALIRELVRSSEGNPKYLRELVRGGLADSSIVQRHGVWLREGRPANPARLIDLVAAELGRLSIPEREAVELIALAEPVSSALARPHIAPQVLERLIENGVVRVEEVPGRGLLTDPALRLSHPSYSECVRSTISPAASHEWYSRVYGSTPPAPHHTVKGFVRWTSWTLECGLKVPPTDLVNAARAASLLGQVDVAIEAATTALESSGDAQTMVDALAIRARELYHSELPHAALRDVDAALALLDAGTLPMDELATESILAIYDLRGDIQQFGLDDPEAALETIDRFFAPVLEGDDHAAHARRHGLARMVSLSWAGDLVTPLTFVDHLVDELNGELDAAPPGMMALTWAGRTTEAKALAAHYETVTIPDHALRAGANLRFAAFLMYIVAGRMNDARACTPDPFSIVESGHFDPAGTYACSGRMLAAEGRWREADDRFQIARQLSDVRDPFGLRVWSMASESFSAAQLGADDRARELLLRIDRTPWRASRGLEADVRCQIIRTLLMLRDPKATDAAVELTAWAAEHGYLLVELWGHDLVAVADPALVRGNGTAERLTELASRVDAPITGPLIGHVRAIIDADPALEEATAAQLGQLGHWVPRRSSRPPSLSRREYEIATLAAAGLSSRVIAERLHLSSRTVEAHISRVFIKLGINRRHQLAGALRQHHP